MSSSKDPFNASPINRKAFKSLIQKARTTGQSEDFYNLGCCHNCGWGTPRNYQKAFEFYMKAGSLPGAEFNLGLLYLGGSGIEQDTIRAVELFKRAAEKGSVQAMHVLSLVLLGDKPTELPYNEEAGREWLFKAAKAGHPSAMNNLGVAYAAGAHGLPMDRIKAVHWLKLAIKRGHDTAKCALLELSGNQPM